MTVFAFALLATAAGAQANAAPPPAALGAEKKICRRESAATGSNMPGKRVCRLRTEWAALDAANERNAEAHRNRASRGVAPGGP